MKLKKIIEYMEGLSKKDRFFRYTYTNDSEDCLFTITRGGYNESKTFHAKDIKRTSDLKNIVLYFYL
jgi:hypothetical protein